MEINSNLDETIEETITSPHLPYGGYKAQRYGKMAQFTLTTTSEILANQTVLIGTISNEKLRPKFKYVHRVYSQNGNCWCLIQLETNGMVSIYTVGGGASFAHNIDSDFTYIPAS